MHLSRHIRNCGSCRGRGGEGACGDGERAGRGIAARRGVVGNARRQQGGQRSRQKKIYFEKSIHKESNYPFK